MKKLLFMVMTVFLFTVSPIANAQWVVTDPTNLAQGIVNSANEIVQTSSTVSNVIKNFKEVEKVYKQGKAYYDKLEAVNHLVKDARRVQQTVLMDGDVSEMYVQNFGKMMNDPNFSEQELKAIGNGYSALFYDIYALIKESNRTSTGTCLALNDKGRMDIIDRVYKEVK